MINIRPSSERGHFDHGWLDTYHTFSFGDYNDPRHMGFRSLRVINEDVVAPGQGFGMHPHRDMEIVTYLVSGALQHRDSMGNGAVLRPGELQRITAGTGILHSEFNPSQDEPVHLLQIWLLPERRGLTPGYEQKAFPAPDRKNAWQLLASHDGRDGSISINQDVSIYGSTLDAGRSMAYEFDADRHGWLQVARGKISVNGKELSQGDGAAISDESKIAVNADEASEVLLFDLA